MTQVKGPGPFPILSQSSQVLLERRLHLLKRLEQERGDDSLLHARFERRDGLALPERELGSFQRRFALPDGVDTDKIDAKLAKGVLTVTLPKKPEAQKPAKTIEVKAAA